jgi:hypothetical protein
MSSFGFDATSPKAGASSSGGKGIFEHTNPFTEVSNARKLQAFQDVEDDSYVHEVWVLLLKADIVRHAALISKIRTTAWATNWKKPTMTSMMIPLEVV